MSDSKHIALRLEFYLRGRSKKPTVSFIGIGNHGVPMTPSLRGRTPPDRGLLKQNEAFNEFSRAAHKFCKQMVAAGEFD